MWSHITRYNTQHNNDMIEPEVRLLISEQTPHILPSLVSYGRGISFEYLAEYKCKISESTETRKKITDKKNSEDEAHYRCKSFIFNIFYSFNFSFTPSSCLVLKTDLHIHGAIRCLLTFKSHVSQLLDMALTFINLEILHMALQQWCQTTCDIESI